MDRTAEHTPRLIRALAACGVAAGLVTAVGLVATIDGVTVIGVAERGTPDYVVSCVFLGIGIVFILVAATLWTSIVQLAHGSRRSARPMLGSLAGLGGFPIAVLLPVADKAGALPLIVGIAIFTGIMLGSAALLRTAVGATAARPV